jgi:hypothetical protein
MKQRLESRYAELRAQLQALQAAPVKDFVKIDRLIDELEKLQLAIKEEHGIKGNNPLE